MLFAGTELAARIERAECRLVRDGTEARRRRHPDARPFVMELGSGVATWAVEGSPLNKVVGLGFGAPVGDADLAELERELARRGSPVQVELACLAEPGIGARLCERGYVLRGFENVLGRALDGTRPSVAAPADVEVRVSPPDELDTWLDVVVTGFASPDAQGVASHEEFPRELLEDVIGDMAAAEGFERYVALRGGRPVGGASLRRFEGVAQLCGAATLPAHRRRGVQTALLAARLSDSARAGCDVAVVTTQPGSKSQQNVQRRGFELLYTRAVLVKDA